MLIGSLSLLATPWLTGFYSKDLIIELAYGQYNFSGIYAFILGSVTAGLTAFYSFRLIAIVFVTYPNASKSSYLNCHESKLAIVIPLLVLSIFSLFFGYLFSDLFIGIGSDFFHNSLFTHPNHISLIEAEFSLPIYIKLLPLIFTLLGITISIYFYHTNLNLITSLTKASMGYKLYVFLNRKYYFDVVYNNYFINSGLKLGHKLSKLIDRGIIELIGPFGLSNLFIRTGLNISKLDTGVITSYALYIVLSLIILLLLLFSPYLLNISFSIEIKLIIIYITAIILLAVLQENLNSNIKNKSVISSLIHKNINKFYLFVTTPPFIIRNKEFEDKSLEEKKEIIAKANQIADNKKGEADELYDYLEACLDNSRKMNMADTITSKEQIADNLLNLSFLKKDAEKNREKVLEFTEGQKVSLHILLKKLDPLDPLGKGRYPAKIFKPVNSNNLSSYIDSYNRSAIQLNVWIYKLDEYIKKVIEAASDENGE